MVNNVFIVKAALSQFKTFTWIGYSYVSSAYKLHSNRVTSVYHSFTKSNLHSSKIGTPSSITRSNLHSAKLDTPSPFTKGNLHSAKIGTLNPFIKSNLHSAKVGIPSSFSKSNLHSAKVGTPRSFTKSNLNYAKVSSPSPFSKSNLYYAKVGTPRCAMFFFYAVSWLYCLVCLDTNTIVSQAAASGNSYVLCVCSQVCSVLCRPVCVTRVTHMKSPQNVSPCLRDEGL